MALTPQQRLFTQVLAKRTGLDPRVIGAWTLAEESGGAAQQRAAQGNNNWLNIGYFDSGPGSITKNQAFRDPRSAADATAKFLQGRFGGASPGIRRILSSTRGGPSAQIQAIAGSGWASSGYNGGNTLRQLYHQVGGNEVGPASPSAGATTRTIPGVDNSGTRKQLIATYLLGQQGIGAAGVPNTDQLVSQSQSLLDTVLAVRAAKDRPARTVTVGGGGGSGRGSQGGVISRRTLGRTDQGVDFTGSGPIPAAGAGVITRVVPRGGPSGWPGGGFVVIKLDHPPDARHQYVYVAENISPTVRVGQRVNAGQKIAHAHGSYPFLETGWAADAQGTTLARATTGYSEGQQTQAGKSFKRFLGV